MTKTLNKNIILFLHQNQNIISATLGIRIFIQKKNHSPPPRKLKQSVPYVINCVSDLLLVGGFLRALRFPSPKIDLHDIVEILLIMALSNITHTPNYLAFRWCGLCLSLGVRFFSIEKNPDYFFFSLTWKISNIS